MVSYAIAAADALAFPNLVVGVTFNFDTETLSVPASVNQVDGQWVIDHCRYAESTFVALPYPPIASASGKVQIDQDPDTGDPIKTGVLAILLEGWKIRTLKTTGVFRIKDVYRSDSTVPYFPIAGVDILYQQSINSSLVFTASGGGGSGVAAEVWNYPVRELTGFGTLTSDIATAVWSAGTRSLTTFGTLVSDLTSAVVAAIQAGYAALVTMVWGHSSRELTARPPDTASDAIEPTVDAIALDLLPLQSATEEVRSVVAGTGTEAVLADTSTTKVVRGSYGDVTLTRTLDKSTGNVSISRS